MADHLADLYALREGGVYVFCCYFCQLSLEQLSLAADCDQVADEPNTDSRTGYLCKVQGSGYAVGECLRGYSNYYHTAVACLLRDAKAIYEQLCQRRCKGVI